MSRRSLRLDDGLLDRSLPHSSASFSVGGTSWRSTRSLKSRRSQQLSVSCSESLLLNTPHKLLNSSLHSVASDASLLSSLLDDSSLQETTLVDTFWGLDQDVDPKESTIIAEQSTVLSDCTLIGSDSRCLSQPVQPVGRVSCKDCELPSDRRESTYCSSSKFTTTTTSSTTSSSSARRPGPSESRDPEPSTIYCRDRRRRTRTAGVLASMLARSAAGVVSLLALLCHHLTRVTDVLQRWLDRVLLGVRRAAACCVSGVWSNHCVVMNQEDSTTSQKDPPPNGTLCEDCKEKKPSETDAFASVSWSSVASCVLVLLWSAVLFTGRTAANVCRWLSRRWNHVTSGLVLTQFHLRLVLVLLPLLLLIFSLCWFGPAGLHSALPVTEWSTVLSDVTGFTSTHSQSTEGAVEQSTELQPYVEEPPQPNVEEPPQPYVEEPPQPYVEEPPQPYVEEPPQPHKELPHEEELGEAARLVRLEQSLTALWERVEAGGRQAEQRHREVLQLYTDFQQQQFTAQSSNEVEQQVEQRLEQFRTRLDEERQLREQARQQDVVQQQHHLSRLDRLEQQLQTLAARAEEVQWRRGAASSATLPAAVSAAVDRQSHDALLKEVTRLEAALEDVRRDVEGLSGCRDDCKQLVLVQQTISAQVREEVRTLLYGNHLTLRGGAHGDGAGLPESLLQWLSQRYISEDDLRVALASLELSILRNISLQLEQRAVQDAVREATEHAADVADATEAAGATVTEEDVHLIVKNALGLFSQDRTGRADYALESGGGSILSTRCSETYETKAALLSLFGVPLWYFSQSPRAVIQPDVHPGNCWAFRGSVGFLVIRLSMRIVPTAVSLEHIPRALAPSGTLHSAPRDFSVYGLDDESQDRGKLLGSYTYDEDGEALQTFAVAEESEQTFQIIEVHVMSNWGHPDYTCMYRFRVHGTPADA